MRHTQRIWLLARIYIIVHVEATGYLLPNCYVLSSTLRGFHWKGESYKLSTKSQAHSRGILLDYSTFRTDIQHLQSKELWKICLN
jgi:hypothetical protein